MALYTVSNYDTDDVSISAVRDAKAVLMTPKGSVPMRRSYGISMDLVDAPVSEVEPLLVQAVKEAIEDAVGGIEVVSVDLEQAEEGRINVRVLIGETDE